MSLNTAHANGGVLIYAGECILLFCDAVELAFEGADGPAFKGTKKGRLYLTTHRMVFTSKDTKDPLQSFSFPFLTMREIELEQPVFGANYIKGKVKAQPGGNWDGQAKFKLYFKNGGAIEYGQAMLQAAKLASRNMPSEPPPYTPPMGSPYQAPPPAYTPPTGGYYGFVPPTHVFPSAPPPGMVFMTDQPPPYPGINTGMMNGYPAQGGGGGGFGAPAPAMNGPPPVPGFVNYANGYPPAGAANFAAPPMMNSADAKAMEAAQSAYPNPAQSAYYNPNNPHTAYMPPPPPGYHQSPPTYDEATKKYQ